MRLVSLAGMLLLCPVLLADGGMFRRDLGESGPMVRSPRQEAVLATDGQRVQVILRTHFERGPGEVGWVVPVPARPTDIRTEETALFDELERATAPRFMMLRAQKPGLACSSRVAEDVASAREAPVAILETGAAGMYDYAVLSARDANELGEWLNANGYLMPPNAEPVLRAYTAENWHWLAIKLRAIHTDHPTLAPQPITYTYADSRLVFPMVISRVSAATRNEIVLYVLAAQRHVPENWAHAVVNPRLLRRDRSAPSGTTYDRSFGDLSERERQVFVTEYADQPPAMPPKLAAATSALGPTIAQRGYLTRLRAIIPPEAMDRDVVLTPSNTQGNVSNLIHIGAADADGPVLGDVSTLMALGIGVWGIGRLRRAWNTASRREP